jgi:hypothetical protein
MILTGFLVPLSFSALVTVALHKTSVSRMEQARMWRLLGIFNLLAGENTDVLPVANLWTWDFDLHGSETCTM